MKSKKRSIKGHQEVSSEEMILLRLAEYEKTFKRLVTKLKKLAKDMGTATIRVPNLKMLASMLGMAYNTEFLEAIRRYRLCIHGYIRKPIGEDYWIEVFPFTADAVAQVERKRV